MIESQICCNFLSANKDKLAKDAQKIPTKGSSISTASFAAFRAFILAFIPTPALISSLPYWFTDGDLQKATKLALELSVRGQEHGKIQVNSTFQNKSLKAKNPDLYYSYCYIEYYYFCWKCKDYFKTAGVTEPKYILFAALFL